MAIIPGKRSVQRESSLAIHTGPGEYHWGDAIAISVREHDGSVGTPSAAAGSKGIGGARVPELREFFFYTRKLTKKKES